MGTGFGVARGSALVVTVILALGGCTGSDEGTRAGAGAQRNGAPGAAGPQAAALSPEAYRGKLATSTSTLNSALAELAKANTYKSLAAKVGAVQRGASQATTTLQRMAPPLTLTLEHANLVAALGSLHTELGTLGENVRDKSLCTGSAVRADLAGGEEAGAVRKAAQALAAKAPDHRVDVKLPAAGKKGTSRPKNGHFLRSGSRGGRGSLTIDNGGDDDAVVSLVKGGRPAISVYVRHGKKYTVSGVRDGNYKVYFTGGSGWDGAARGFSRDCAFERFDKSLEFETVRTATQIKWRTWQITLQPVAGGDATTSEVEPGEFPQT